MQQGFVAPSSDFRSAMRHDTGNVFPPRFEASSCPRRCLLYFLVMKFKSNNLDFCIFAEAGNSARAAIRAHLDQQHRGRTTLSRETSLDVGIFSFVQSVNIRSAQSGHHQSSTAART